ncbi:putative ABC transporter permease [Candidatus Saccharibacteria bacterium]|nr:putative ABC transporter permease [Candidatus Saccharibacteria bacterium]
MVVKRRKSYKETFREYLEKGVKLERWQKVGVLFLVVVIAGFMGWLYEFVFYFFDGGMTEWYMQGGNLLPWINIYAIGAILIVVTTYKLRRWPWMVFLVSVLVTGALELVGGWLVYTIGDGTRYWDYNTEILNFGNIGGFVCLRSVLVFGVSALFLMYLVVPFCVWLAQRMSKRAFLTLAVGLFAVVMADEVVNLTLKNLDLPTAMDFYRSLGLKYK